MTDNTQKRIYSSIILISLLALCYFLGRGFFLVFILFFGVISIDELHCNFVKRKRFDSVYFFGQLIFLVPFIYCNFIDKDPFYFRSFTIAALALNTMLLVYFFLVKMGSKVLFWLVRKMPNLYAFIILLPMMALADLIHYPNWHSVLALLLMVTCITDTGAWFFGRKVGKRSLCPQISPSKTVEGFIFGLLSAGVLGVCIWEYFSGDTTLIIFGVFCFLGLLDQIGDLVQSKIKRQFDIKDSSSLIPGHGGFYDRIDGLLFLAPFYSFMLRFF